MPRLSCRRPWNSLVLAIGRFTLILRFVEGSPGPVPLGDEGPRCTGALSFVDEMSKLELVAYAVTFLVFAVEAVAAVARGTFGALNLTICILVAAAAICVAVASRRKPTPPAGQLVRDLPARK